MMNVIEKHSLIFLGLLLLVFGFIRLYKINEIPSLHGDEVDFGYNAYSILKTGKDMSGVSYPIGTVSSGDYRPALYMYLTIPSIRFFGFNETAIRIPSIVFSLMTIVLIYFVALKLFSDRLVALFSSAFLGFSFWHITLSREASEKIVALFFILLGIYWLFYFLRKKQLLLLFASMISFFLSIHTYYSPRLFLMIFLPAVWIIYQTSLLQRTKMIFAFAIVIFVATTAYFTIGFHTSSERINQLLIFRHPQTMALLGEQIREEGHKANTFITRIFHNKVVNFSLTIAKNYGEYFSPQFLFFDGGFPRRVKIPSIGLINIIEFPLIVYGAYRMVVETYEKRKKYYMIVFIWTFLAFVPASLTFDEIPNIYRTILALPAINMFAAFGLINIWKEYKNRRWFRSIGLSAVVIYCWMFFYFFHQYFVHYEIHASQYRNYAQKELAAILQKDYKSDKRIFVTTLYGGVEQMLRYYLDYDPVNFAKLGYPKNVPYTGFDNILFVPDICPYPQLVSKIRKEYSGDLIIVNASECRGRGIKEDIDSKASVYWKDGSLAYYVVEVSADSTK